MLMSCQHNLIANGDKETWEKSIRLDGLSRAVHAEKVRRAQG